MEDPQVNSNSTHAIKRSLAQQLPVFVICALLLDGGKMLRVCLIAILGFWLLAFFLLTRSQRDIDSIGVAFVRYGFPILFGLLLLANHYLRPNIRH